MKLAWTPARRRTALVAAWLASTVLLVVCFRGVDSQRGSELLANVRPGWILLAIAANSAIIACMAAFWRTLRPVTEPPVAPRRMLEIVSTATALMNTMPFGGGHASAVLLLMRRGSTSQRGALSVLALDQLGEGLVKSALFLLVGLLLPMPPWLRAGAMTTSVAVAAWLAALLVAARWRHELAILRSPARAAAALGCVIGMKVAELLGLLAVQHALAAAVSLQGTLLVLAAVILGTMVPVAPGNLGTYEASAFVAYRYLGLPPEQALGLALVQHVCFLLPSVGICYLVVSAHAVLRRAIASR